MRQRKKKTAPKKQARQPFAMLPDALDIHKIGRPSKYDPTFCDLALELGAAGKSIAQMAAAIGISRETLNEWRKQHKDFSDAIKNALDLSLAWWEDAGQHNMTCQGFNATAYIFQIKNRFRDDYKDVSQVDTRRLNKEPHEYSNEELAAIARGGSAGTPKAANGSAGPDRLH